MKLYNLLKPFVLILPLINLTQAVICDKIDNVICSVRKTLVNLNENEPRYYPFSIELNKCGGSCDTIDNPLAKTCKSNKSVERIVKAYDMLYSRYVPMTVVEDISCKCECRLNSDVCKSNQRWDKERCKCKCDMYNKCRKGYIWDYSVCDCVNYNLRKIRSAISDTCDNDLVNRKSNASKLTSFFNFLYIFYLVLIIKDVNC